MKFRRMLAALLTAMMIVSCFSFTASAEEALPEGDVAVEAATEAEEEAEEIAEEAVLSEETTEGETTAGTVTITLYNRNGSGTYAWKSATEGIVISEDNTVTVKEGLVAGDAFTLPDISATYPQRVFKGWAASATGEVIHAANAEITVPEESTAFFAVWENGTPSDKAIYNMPSTSGFGGTRYYDAVSNVTYRHFTNTTDAAKIVSINSSSSIFGSSQGVGGGMPEYKTIKDYADKTGGTLYLVSAVRTNVTTAKAAWTALYQSANVDLKFGNPSNSTGNIAGGTGEWERIVIPVSLYTGWARARQVVFYPVGSYSLAANGTEYYDIPAFAIFESETAANAYDPTDASKLGFKISFDLNYTDAPELTAAPTKAPEREGYEFEGWSTNKDAIIGDISDLTRIANIPSKDTTYYAIWKSVSADVEVTVSYDTHGGSTVEAETYTYNPTRESYVTLPAAPTKENYTFKGWATAAHGEVLDPENVLVPEYDTTYYAVWEMASPAEAGDTLYVSTTLGCDGCNNGFSATYPVKTFAKAQTILKANEGITNVIVIGTFTSSKDNDEFGVAGREITVSGYDSNAIFDYDAQKDGGDDDLQIKGPVVFKNITIIDGSGDGMMWANGQHVTFGEGVSPNKTVEIAGNGGSAVIDITSGTFGRVFPGIVSNGTKEGNVTVNISGGTVSAVGIGHGWRGNTNFYGTYRVNVNGGTVNEITANTNGAESANGYKGLRYYTINDGNVKNIVTTEGSQYKDNSNPQRTLTVPARTGVTVYEINKKGVVTGKIARGANVVTGAIEDDDATRIVIFNNDSYEEGKVTDPNAIVIAATNGTIHADVTVNADYTTVLNGYRYTTDATNEYIYINGTNYRLSDFASAGEEASLSEEVTVLIPAEMFTAESDNVAIFSEAPICTVTWKNGEETIKTELVAEGSTLTAPAVNKASTKATYYTLKAWNDGTQDIADITAYTVPVGGATLTAVFEEHAMPASASIQYSAFSQVNNVAGVFTYAVETIDGVEAVKITPASDSDTAINLEGSGKYPLNYSTGAKTNVLDPTIYDYAVYRYYYVPGTNTEDRTFYIWYQKHPWEDKTLVAPDGGSFTMEAGKWTYIVDKLDIADGTEPDLSIQYHLRPMNNVAAKALAANGEYIYVDAMYLFSAEPTVATVTFKGDDGEVLYAIDALNSEAVTYNGAAVEKADHTFKGWAIEGTTEVVDALTFAQDTVLVPVFEVNTSATADYTVETYTMGTDGTYGEAVTETKTAIAGAQVSVESEAKTGFTIADTSVLTGTAAEDGSLVLKVYYARNQYKLYTKTDADAEAVEAGVFYYEAPVTAPAEPTKTYYTFKSWDAEVPANMPANDVTLTATWEKIAYTTVYVSDNGVDTNDGITAKTPVNSMTAANKIIADNTSIDTMVIVGYYTNKVAASWMSYDPIGVAGRDITIVGDTPEAVFDWTAGSDCGIILSGNVTIDDITLKGDTNDGQIRVGANKLVFGNGVIYTPTNVPANIQQFYPNITADPVAGSTTEVEINSGRFRNVLAGTINQGTVSGDVSYKINGGEVWFLSLCKPYQGVKTYKGKFTVEINGGYINSITLRGSGSNAANQYEGLRYFTINGGTVGGIITTSTNKYGANLENTLAENKRIGTTVFEINKKGALAGTAKTDSGVTDESTRIIIFNNGSYEAGKVLDTGAITIAVTNGALKADVTMNADYTTVLNGYSYTTDAANKYININGTNYSLSDFTNVDDATLAEEITVLIPATLFEAGENTAVFSETPLYEIKWVDGEETVRTDGVAAGTVPTAPVLTKTGYTLSWDPEVVEASADATYTAVWTANKHNVIYTLDGAEYNKTEVAYGETVEILAAPAEKAGYTFSGWSKAESFTMPDEDVTITGTFTVNNYTVTYKVDGEAYGDPDTYAYGADVTMREAPTKTGYTFSGWDKTLTTMPAENVVISGTFTKDFATTPTYNTYGYYDALAGTYKVELKFSGAKVNQGSFGFVFPAEQMTFKSVTANAEAGIEFLKDGDSPIYANGEGYYANTWAVGTVENAGHIDATTAEVLVATLEFTMSEAQRTAFEQGILANGKLEEYKATTSIKYYNGTNYIVTIHAGDFSFDRQAVVYEAHHDEVVASGVKYYTYGKYDTLREEYSIEIKVKGAKINLGAFGIAFNESYMTFDPNAQDSVTMADGIANYLDIVINNTKEGYAFGWDGSSTSEGYVDASENEVLIATIKTKMTAEQRAAFENAGKTMSLYDASNIEEDISKYYDGENYLVSVYVGGLATPKLATKYEGHSDEVLEVTEANVEVTVNFTSKLGETKANIAYIKLGDEVTALETAGNAETSATKTYEYLKVGQSYKIRVEKNGYLAAEVDYTVAVGDNKIVINLIAGDIKGAETATCGDGTIDLSDFVRLIRAFDTDASENFIATVDIDESGAVNVSDLAIIKANYNKTSAETVITYNGEEAAG